MENYYGYSKLHIAVAELDLIRVCEIIESGFSVNVRTPAREQEMQLACGFETPLHFAAECGCLDTEWC